MNAAHASTDNAKSTDEDTKIELIKTNDLFFALFLFPFLTIKHILNHSRLLQQIFHHYGLHASSFTNII
jgi:hypothetical protein